MSPIVQVRSMTKRILNFHDQLDRVQSMTKTRQENDMIDRTGHDMLQIEPRDISYRFGLC